MRTNCLKQEQIHVCQCQRPSWQQAEGSRAARRAFTGTGNRERIQIQKGHGDLWGGNLHIDEQGAPCLIDPAAYGGHREMDLAMMRLFGGFAEGVFRAYEEEWPLAPGHAERIALYQLYPLMVHVNLFGGGYVRSVESALAHYV